MQPFNAPLYKALITHAGERPASFHVPGHHNGRVIRHAAYNNHLMTEAATRYFPLMEIDLTELSSTDDLHHPEASIQEAQQLAAICFGAEHTRFLVGGSTSGNLALLLAICDPGDAVIVQRNVHKSVINGLRLAGASAIFLPPQLDAATGLATIPAIEQVAAALLAYPRAKAVFVTNPNYYGMSVRLEPYAALAHQYNIPLLVDEAHGAHYGFHPDLPGSALAAGADAVVQSTHKTLPALTMGAMLHLQGELLNKERLGQSLAMIQSSSPSFPIMASLDISRAIMADSGRTMIAESLQRMKLFHQWLIREQLIISAVVWTGQHNKENGLQHDPLRVLLYEESHTLTGYELQQELEGQGCWAEMADTRYVVLVMGIYMSEEQLDTLKSALTVIHKRYAQPIREGRLNNTNNPFESKMGSLAASVQEGEAAVVGAEATSFNWGNVTDEAVPHPVSFARQHLKEMNQTRVKLQEAEGMQSAEEVVPYPPGIPILYPGEVITGTLISQIEQLSAAGARFQGAQDASFQTIAVFAQRE